jgi:hypothetical protein
LRKLFEVERASVAQIRCFQMVADQPVIFLADTYTCASELVLLLRCERHAPKMPSSMRTDACSHNPRTHAHTHAHKPHAWMHTSSHAAHIRNTRNTHTHTHTHNTHNTHTHLQVLLPHLWTAQMKPNHRTPAVGEPACV